MKCEICLMLIKQVSLINFNTWTLFPLRRDISRHFAFWACTYYSRVTPKKLVFSFRIVGEVLIEAAIHQMTMSRADFCGTHSCFTHSSPNNILTTVFVKHQLAS